MPSWSWLFFWSLAGGIVAEIVVQPTEKDAQSSDSELCQLAEQDLQIIQHTINVLHGPIYEEWPVHTENESCRRILQDLFGKLRKLSQLFSESLQGDLSRSELQEVDRVGSETKLDAIHLVEALAVKVSQSDRDSLIKILGHIFYRLHIIRFYEKHTDEVFANDEQDQLKFWMVQIYSESLIKVNNANENQTVLFKANAAISAILKTSFDHEFGLIDVAVSINNYTVRTEALLEIPLAEFEQNQHFLIKLTGAFGNLSHTMPLSEKITEHRKHVIKERTKKLETIANPIFEEWLTNMDKPSLEKALPVLSCSQMKNLGQKVSLLIDDTRRNIIKEMLASTENINLACAYHEIVESHLPQFITPLTIFLRKHMEHWQSYILGEFYHINNLLDRIPLELRELAECSTYFIIKNSATLCVHVKGPSSVMVSSGSSCDISMEPSSDQLRVKFSHPIEGGSLHVLKTEDLWELSINPDGSGKTKVYLLSTAGQYLTTGASNDTVLKNGNPASDDNSFWIECIPLAFYFRG